MNGSRDFFKKEFTLIAAAAAAAVSCLFVPVTNYADYIDTDVIGLLFCLMIAAAGSRECGVPGWLYGKLLGKGAPGTRRVGTVLAMLTFAASVLFTGQAALIALLPVTAALFENRPGSLPYVITVQTAAANLGSVLTPYGNRQGLYLYERYDLSPEEYFSVTVPMFLAGGALVLLLCLFIKDEPLGAERSGTAAVRDKRYLILYAALFALCVLAAAGVLNVIVVFASVCAVAAIIDMRLFGAVDYGLLATAALWFIFIGNIRNTGAAQDLAANIPEGREMLAAAGASQIIGGKTAAEMLSEHTGNVRALLLGTDIGSLGTIAASPANLISLRVYTETGGAKPCRYLGVFTAVNILALGIMLGVGTLITAR